MFKPVHDNLPFKAKTMSKSPPPTLQPMDEAEVITLSGTDSDEESASSTSTASSSEGESGDSSDDEVEVEQGEVKETDVVRTKRKPKEPAAGKFTLDDLGEASTSDDSFHDDSSGSSDGEVEDDDDSSAPSMSDWDEEGDEGEGGASTSAVHNTEEVIEATLKLRLSKAFKAITERKDERAMQILKSLLDHDAFDDMPRDLACISTTPTPKRSLLNITHQVYYSALKTLARLHSDVKHDDEEALECYLLALMIDNHDRDMWFGMSCSAAMCGRLSLAVHGLDHVLSLQRFDRGALDRMISVLFALGQYEDCLLRCRQLHSVETCNRKAIVVAQEIFAKIDHLATLTIREEFADAITPSAPDRTKILARIRSITDKYNCLMVKEKTKTTVIVTSSMTRVTWASLGEAICATYTMCQTKFRATLPLDLSPWLTDIEEIHQRAKDARAAEEEMLADAQTRLRNSMEPSTATETEAATTTDDEVPMKQVEGNAEDDSWQIVHELLADLVKSVARQEVRDKKTKTKREGTRKSRRQQQTTVADDISISQFEQTPGKSKADMDKTYARRSGRHVPGAIEDGPDNQGYVPDVFDEYRALIGRPLLMSYVSGICDAFSKPDVATAPSDRISVRISVTDRVPEQTPPTSPAFVPTDFVDDEDEIITFITACQHRSAIDLLELYIHKFVDALAQWASFAWPTDMKTAFVTSYELWRSSVPNHRLMLPLMEIDPKVLRECCWKRQLHLLYAELCHSLGDRATFDRQMYDTVVQRELLNLATIIDGSFGDIAEYAARVYWLLYQRRGTKTTAEERLANIAQCAAYIAECKEIVNAQYAGYSLDLAKVTDHQTSLEKASMLENVNDLFTDKQYDKVVDVLLTVLRAPGDENNAAVTANVSPEEICMYEYMLLRCFDRLDRCVDILLWAAQTISHTLELIASQSGLADLRTARWSSLRGMLTMLDKFMADVDWEEDDQYLQLLTALVDVVYHRMLLSGKAFNECPLPSPLPWMLLYKAALSVERAMLNNKEYLKNWYRTGSNQRVVLATRSLMVLHEAHNQLGSRSCCTSADGARLLLLTQTELRQMLHHPTVQTLLEKEKRKAITDDMLSAAEQCFYCLYDYPQKRKRHIAEHSAKSVALTWDRCAAVFDFILPSGREQPEFDGYANDTICAEAVQMLRRIERLVPEGCSKCLTKAVFNRRLVDRDYSFEWPKEFADEKCDARFIMSNLYHLVADFHFKSQNWDKAVEYYELDLCVGRTEHTFDSWGGMSLAASAALFRTLYSLEYNSTPPPISVVMASTQTCLTVFARALQLNADHGILMMEQATFAYQMQSYYVRFSRRLESADPLAARLQSESRAMIDEAYRLLTRAIELDDEKEAWLIYYYLGKIAEKRRQPVLEILEFYTKSAFALQADGAKYPERVRYGRQDKAFEVIEIHYRVHCVILKRLATQSKLVDLSLMLQYARMFREHATVRSQYPKDAKKKGWLSPSTDPDVAIVVASLITATVRSTYAVRYDRRMLAHQHAMASKSTNTESPIDPLSLQIRQCRRLLVDYCLDAMRLCIKRFINFYKPYYRLAWAYCNIREVRNYRTAENVLMSSGQRGGLTVGLFTKRRPTYDIFDGIWQLPSEDIERQGSLTFHMQRSVRLVMHVVGITQTIRTAVDMLVGLCKTPDTDKRYMCDVTRRLTAMECSGMVVAQYDKMMTAIERACTAFDGLEEAKKHEVMTKMDEIIGAIGMNMVNIEKFKVPGLREWQRRLLRVCACRLTASEVATPAELTITQAMRIVHTLEAKTEKDRLHKRPIVPQRKRQLPINAARPTQRQLHAAQMTRKAVAPPPPRAPSPKTIRPETIDLTTETPPELSPKRPRVM